MIVEDIIIPTRVARAGWTVRDVIRECVASGVRAIPYCDADGPVAGLCSVKNIAKHALIPEYMVDAANVLGDEFLVLEEAHERASRILGQPIEPFLYDAFWCVGSKAPLMKAIAIIEKNRADYAFVIDDGRYKGVVTVLGIARQILALQPEPESDTAVGHPSRSP